MPSFLHVGCGKATKADLPAFFHGNTWDEIRLDIDPTAQPDIIGSITAMPRVADASVDAVYSAHNIEHLFPHEVDIALREFLRVLRPGGFAVVTCPDLQEVAKHVAQGKIVEALYVSDSGPVTPIDIIFGMRTSTRSGNPYMAHRCGFTLGLLLDCLTQAGFGGVAGFARPEYFSLWTLARREKVSNLEMTELANRVFAQGFGRGN